MAAPTYYPIWTSPTAINSDDQGAYIEYILENESAVSDLPTQGDTFGGPRPGSLALLPPASGAAAKLYVLGTDRTWSELCALPSE